MRFAVPAFSADTETADTGRPCAAHPAGTLAAAQSHALTSAHSSTATIAAVHQ